VTTIKQIMPFSSDIANVAANQGRPSLLWLYTSEHEHSQSLRHIFTGLF
jgi:hypothetical protein